MTALAVLGLVAGQAVSAEDEHEKQEAAVRMLHKAGLEKSGDRWLLAAESRLQQRFALMDRWHTEAVQSQKNLRRLISTQRAIQKEIDALQAIGKQLEEALAKQPNQAQINQRIKQNAARLETLNEKRFSPSELAHRPEVRDETIRLLNVSSRINLLKINAAKRVRELQAAYQALSDNEPTREALAALNVQERLGSDQNYREQRKQLAAIANEVVPERWPVYGQNGQWRTSLIVEERQPSTVTIVKDTKAMPYPAWLPDSVLRAGGIPIPDSAPYLALTLPDGRRVPTRVLRVAYLRLGRYRIGGAEVLALRPEDEDLGGQISLQFLEKHGLRLDQEFLPAIIGK